MNKMLLLGNINKKEYDELIVSGTDIAKNLHWKYLPIYEEQIIIIDNVFLKNIFWDTMITIRF